MATSQLSPASPDADGANWPKNKTPFWEKLAVLIALGLLIVNILTLSTIRDSNAISTKAFQSAQRAFVAHGKVDHKIKAFPSQAGKQESILEFTTEWENAGNSPAIGVLGLFGSVGEADELTEAEFMGLGMGLPSPRAVSSIGPKNNWESAPMRQPESFVTERPDLNKILYGWILYEDIFFPETKVHVTEFCWKSANIRKLPDGDYEFNGIPCQHHNCVDQLCEDYASIVTLSKSY
ncbi:MAG: hypothetical protein ACLQBK_06930 [Candidatus Sulfotelmatobacter sp.]